MAEPEDTVTTVTGADVGAAKDKAVEEATTAAPAPDVPAVEHIPDTPKPDDGMDELRTTVAALATAVDNLTNIVTGTTPRDEAPHSRPWTHWGKP
jgi:hypothetical protein